MQQGSNTRPQNLLSETQQELYLATPDLDNTTRSNLSGIPRLQLKDLKRTAKRRKQATEAGQLQLYDKLADNNRIQLETTRDTIQALIVASRGILMYSSML
jgi:hypothetical protein